MISFSATTARAGAVGIVALAALIAAQPAHAQLETLTFTIAPTSLSDPGTYPTLETIGSFGNAALGQYDTVVGATVAGSFGYNVLSPTTAAGQYFVGGELAFTCNDGDACWGGSIETPWSFSNFTAADLQALAAGNTLFTVSQTDVGQVQTDTTTLTLEVYVPEPASIALFGASLLGLGFAVRHRAAMRHGAAVRSNRA
jgi:hypothetical protein